MHLRCRRWAAPGAPKAARSRSRRPASTGSGGSARRGQDRRDKIRITLQDDPGGSGQVIILRAGEDPRTRISRGQRAHEARRLPRRHDGYVMGCGISTPALCFTGAAGTVFLLAMDLMTVLTDREESGRS